MVIKTPIRHYFIVNDDKEIIDSIIHFLLYSQEEAEKYQTFETPSNKNMYKKLQRFGHGMMSWYVEDLCNRLGRVRPWVESPREFFASNRAINYLRNIKEII